MSATFTAMSSPSRWRPSVTMVFISRAASDSAHYIQPALSRTKGGGFSRPTISFSRRRWSLVPLRSQLVMRMQKNLSRACPGSTRLARSQAQPGALVGGTVAQIRIAVRAEHVDRSGERFTVGALPRYECDARLDFVADFEN